MEQALPSRSQSSSSSGKKSNVAQLVASSQTGAVRDLVLSDPSYLSIPLDEDGRTLLHLAAASGNIDLLNFITSDPALLSSLPPDAHIDINKQDTGGYTALHIAAKSGKNDAVQMLLAVGADTTVKDGHGRSVLHWAAENGKEELACLIFSSATANAGTNNQDLFGRTPLHWAAKRGLQKLTSMMLDAGAQVDIQTKGGETALHWAALEGHTQVIEMLLKAGANPIIKNNTDQSPVDVASTSHATQIIQRAMGFLSDQSKEEVYSQQSGEAAIGGVKKHSIVQPKKLKITLKKK